jgi:hypothetical protein
MLTSSHQIGCVSIALLYPQVGACQPSAGPVFPTSLKVVYWHPPTAVRRRAPRPARSRSRASPARGDSWLPTRGRCCTLLPVQAVHVDSAQTIQPSREKGNEHRRRHPRRCRDTPCIPPPRRFHSPIVQPSLFSLKMTAEPTGRPRSRPTA